MAPCHIQILNLEMLTWAGCEGEQELRNLSGYDRVIIAKLEQEGLCKVRVD